MIHVLKQDMSQLRLHKMTTLKINECIRMYRLTEHDTNLGVMLFVYADVCPNILNKSHSTAGQKTGNLI